MNNYTIRIANLYDLPKIDALSNNVFEEYGLPCDSAVEELDAVYFLNQGSVTQGLARFWVAVSNGNVVGSAAIVPLSDKICIFKTFYVREDYRGRRIGYHIYKTAEEFATDVGYEMIKLFVSQRFSYAIKFYLMNGYESVGKVDNLWEDKIYCKSLG